MKIHNSILPIEPAGSKQQNTLVSTFLPPLDNGANEARKFSPSPLSSNEQFATAVEQKRAQELVAAPALGDNSPTRPIDLRTSKALNTYSSTFNQLPQQHIKATVSGIDFFV